MAFYVGQKVIYVGPDAAHVASRFNVDVPERNVIYTIRDLNMRCNTPSLLLVEITNTERHWADGFYELALDQKYFRPVVENKTDISIFTKMLTDTRIPARVDD